MVIVASTARSLLRICIYRCEGCSASAEGGYEFARMIAVDWSKERGRWFLGADECPIWVFSYRIVTGIEIKKHSRELSRI